MHLNSKNDEAQKLQISVQDIKDKYFCRAFLVILFIKLDTHTHKSHVGGVISSKR